MNNKIFLKDGECEITYGDLISEINSRDYYYPKYKGTDLNEFYINFIIGLISNNPIILLDSDITTSELDLTISYDINIKKDIVKERITDLTDLIDLIRSSSSEIVIFTSGTTGQPKEVHHSFANLSRAVKTGDKFLNNIWGFAYNPTHMAGLQVFLQAFMNGNTLINIFNKDRKHIFKEIEQFKITHISATPTFYRLLLPFEKEYPSVVRVSLGGEKSGKELYDAINRIFPNAKVTNIYASTEAGTLFATQDDYFKIPDTIKDKVKVIGDELFVHKSLLGSSDSFKYEGEYYPTGDLIEWVDKTNSLFRFKSRKNELINVGGYKVNPSEVEDKLRGIPGIREAYVFGKQNSILGNVLCADIISINNSLSEIDIRSYLQDQLQDFKIPRRIKFVESLPITRTGKMSRK